MGRQAMDKQSVAKPILLWPQLRYGPPPPRSAMPAQRQLEIGYPPLSGVMHSGDMWVELKPCWRNLPYCECPDLGSASELSLKRRTWEINQTEQQPENRDPPFWRMPAQSSTDTFSAEASEILDGLVAILVEQRARRWLDLIRCVHCLHGWVNACACMLFPDCFRCECWGDADLNDCSFLWALWGWSKVCPRYGEKINKGWGLEGGRGGGTMKHKASKDDDQANDIGHWDEGEVASKCVHPRASKPKQIKKEARISQALIGSHPHNFPYRGVPIPLETKLLHIIFRGNKIM